MRAFSGSTVVEQSSASNRRQPVRHTRNNPARTASSGYQAQGGPSAQTPNNERPVEPGFFPALTHYTDAITALPKEMIRHNSMLKEVDAKIYGPEAQLAELVNTALKMPLPSRSKISKAKPDGPNIQQPVAPAGSLTSSNAEISQPELSSQPMNQDTSDPAYPRRLHFHNIRSTLLQMLATLDEKNHVLNTSIDCLSKQNKRCDSSFRHIKDEISEEARLGSLTHWAYTDKAAEKKGMVAGERTRRAANNVAAIQEAEMAALRSESRREALAAKKPRNQHLDSDFDDSKVVTKKSQAGAKGRKVADTSITTSVGLGIANGTAPPSKRRKIEKPTPANMGVEKAMASVFGSSLTSSRETAGNSKDASVNEASGKKRGRGGTVTNGVGRRRSVKPVLHTQRLC